MKIAATSDMHGIFPEIPKADVLCIAGDICPTHDHSFSYQRKWVLTEFCTWCQGLVRDGIVKNVVFIAGNHDWVFEDLMEKNEEAWFRSSLPEDVFYLRDSEVIIDGIRFWGTPHTPPFCDWAFNVREEGLNEIFSKIPEGIDVLISHGPPYEYWDSVDWTVRQTDPLGSKALIQHVKRAHPRYTFSGHIHTGNHVPQKVIHENKNINVVNVSLINEQYEKTYPVFECEI